MKEVARDFRKESTPSEATLWKALRGRALEGRKFRRQQPIGPFVVDFYCAAERLVVEVDGGVHESQVARDRERKHLLEALGLRFVRIPASVVENDLSTALTTIRRSFTPTTELAIRTEPVPPLPLWERGSGGEGAVRGRGEGALSLCEGVAWLEEAARLSASGTPFVLATVVAREAPQSARTGSKAMILPDGSLVGWVGGGCVRPTVLRESLAALRDGRPRLVRINPGAAPDTRSDVRVYAMICQGEGAVDIYLEPVLPRLELLVFGRTPVAEALVRLARPLEITVRVVDPHADPARFPGAAEVLADYGAAAARITPRSLVVVATMGEGDEEALQAALAADSAYVGLVASRKKASALLEFVRGQGAAPERIARVKAPAGLNFGAVTPAEIALSILAEIVQIQRAPMHVEHPPVPDAVPATYAAKPTTAEVAPSTVPPTGESSGSAAEVQVVAERTPAAEPPEALTAVDPVCGMAVEIRTARHSLEHEGHTYYFCCPHCKARFAKDPARYLVATPG